MGQEEWLELESDPGLFTLLVEDLGVTGVQVDEIYELTKAPSDPVLGFIFLFRWQQNEKKSGRRGSRGGTGSLNSSQASSTAGDTSFTVPPVASAANTSPGKIRGSNYGDQPVSESVSSALKDGGGDCEENLFFAHQVVPNSCATHSLLSILMNTSHQAVNLGPLLTEFRRATRPLSPNVKGLAIGFMPPLMEAHNRHARQQNPRVTPNLPPACDEAASVEVVRRAVEAAKKAASEEGDSIVAAATTSTAASATAAASTSLDNSTTSAVDHGYTFHFICFLPVGRFLYELDGLKQKPINHGLLEDPVTHAGWTRQCLSLLRQRMREQEVRYNLMAVVPDRRLALASRLDNLEKNRSILEKTIQQLTNSNATAVAIKLEHNGKSEGRGGTVGGEEGHGSANKEKTSADVTRAPDVQCHLLTTENYSVEVKPEEKLNGEMKVEDDSWTIDVEGELGDVGEDGGRPVTRAASRAAAAMSKLPPHLVKRSSRKQTTRSNGSTVSSPTSICIDLTESELSASSSTANNNALVDENSEASATSTELSNVEANGDSLSTKQPTPSLQIGVTTRRRASRESSTPTQSSPASTPEKELRHSKYPTRSSTKRDTLASHSLASTRSAALQLHPPVHPEKPENEMPATTTAFLTTENLTQLLEGIDAQARACSAALAEEESKRYAYRVDSARRIHNYDPFIRTFLTELMIHGLLHGLVVDATGGTGEITSSVSAAGRQLRKRKLASSTPQKTAWSSSSALSTSSSSTGSTSYSLQMQKKSNNAAAGGALSRLAVKRARLTAVGNRPSTRLLTASSGGVGGGRRSSRRSL
ncbi:unnamed protein product [Mesocestoides corti]|uniref:ubiquitinyl hydrolase 1 n=1 Tax=Mesocestoides corti TaxID=53468 RepID=A0A0R3UP99_MESCO|nr:unnamed protein product [Mesocestoides corti]